MAVVIAILRMKYRCSLPRDYLLELSKLFKESARRIVRSAKLEGIPLISPPDLIGINWKRYACRIGTENLFPREIASAPMEEPLISKCHQLLEKLLGVAFRSWNPKSGKELIVPGREFECIQRNVLSPSSKLLCRGLSLPSEQVSIPTVIR